ncbi:MAG: sugar transferase [Acidimicrobiia bacterium]|nr:sugar transferase [Acidimicrobiia bacterium]
MRQAARLIFVAGTAATIYGAAFLHALVLAPEPYQLLGDSRLGWWTVLFVATLVVGYATGLPELPQSRLGAAVRGAVVPTSTLLALAVAQSMLATPLLPRSSMLVMSLVLPVWTVMAWNISVDTNDWAAARDRVFLVIENEEDLNQVSEDLNRGPERPATVAGWMALADIDGHRSPRLLNAVVDTNSTVLVLDVAAQSSARVIDQAAHLHERGVRIRSLALFYEEWMGKLPHRELARISLLFDIGEVHRLQYVRAKRVVDVAFGLVGSVALLPVIAAVAVLNLGFNRGPLFYSQPRVGQGGREFTILKLRTMAPHDGPSEWTTEGDTRITPLGSLLRRSHLDELPQVLNILRGDLALVGPRPEQPHYVEELREKIAFYDVRHLVRPGLTGWAQVKQGYTADENDAYEKLQYDFFYLRRQGLSLDGRIIWRTLRGVVGGDGR